MNVLVWHVHGSWMTAFVQGSHRYYIPVVPDRSADGRGRAVTWEWPQSAIEIEPQPVRNEKFDVVVLQRPHEYELTRQMFGITPGVDVPAIYVEHNAPQGLINQMRHPLADVNGVSFVHVTNFNDLFWDCGESPTRVIEHGVVDPGYRYTGEVAKAAVVINEPERRARVTGTDLVDRISTTIPLELFGMGAGARGGYENLRQSELHDQLPKRRVYFHPIRWTSLGLSLIEAMHLGMPVVALATTEIPEAVPDDAGITSTNVRSLAEALRDLLQDPQRAKALGLRARAHARERYGLERFLRDWDSLFEDTVC